MTAAFRMRRSVPLAARKFRFAEAAGPSPETLLEPEEGAEQQTAASLPSVRTVLDRRNAATLYVRRNEPEIIAGANRHTGTRPGSQVSVLAAISV